MRILALVTDAFGGYGGIAQYNRDLLCALSLSEQVGSVVVLPRTAPPCAAPLPRKIEQLRPSQARTAYSLRALGLARRRERFDIVFCGHVYQAPLAIALGASVWLQAHGIEAWEPPSRLARAAIARCSLVTAVSRFTRRRMLRWARLAPERVRVLPPALRPVFSPGPARIDKLAAWGLAGARVVLTVARTTRADAYKGHHLVIAAMERVRERAPSAVYAIVGAGDGRADLEALVRSRGLEDGVRFLGRLADEDLLDLYRSAAVFAMPSVGEGFGIAFIEAAAAGLPVIGGGRDGSPDALADGVIGRLVDPASSERIADAILDALAAPPSSRIEAAQRFAFVNFARHVDILLRNFPR